MAAYRKPKKQARKSSKAIGAAGFEWRKPHSLALLTLPVIGLLFYLPQAGTWLPVNSIQLSGSFQYQDQRKIETMLQAFIGESFFSLDIHRVGQMLSANSWTQSVSIRRLWPDKIDIVITERNPAGRWDDTHLISQQAVVFKADTTDFNDLPRVYSANGKPRQILSRYYRLQAQFSRLRESVKSVLTDSRGALEIKLENNLTIKVGRENVDYKLQRLMSIYETQIQPRRLDMRQIDLRYSNGFAVAWKQTEHSKQVKSASTRGNSDV